jgi:hypothetical protein
VIEVFNLHKVWNNKVKHKGTITILKKMDKINKIKINHPKTNKRGKKISNKEMETNAYNEIELTYEIMVLTRKLKTMPKVHKKGLKGRNIIKERLMLLKKGVKAYESNDVNKIESWRRKNINWLKMNSGFGRTHFGERNLNYK